MLQIRRLFVILSPLGALVLLISCGPLVTSSTQSAPTVIIGHKLTATPTIRRTPIAKPTATPQSSPVAKVGSVTVQLGALLYHMGDTITVTVHNQSNQTIAFPDHLTDCTVILLRTEGGQAVGLCRLLIVTRLHRLGAGGSLTVTLRVPSSGWPAGLYHAVLTYGAPGGAHTVSSQSFLLV